MKSTKFISGRVLLLTLGFSLAFVSFLLGKTLVLAHGDGGDSDGRWGSWHDTSSCSTNVCDTTQGTKTQSRSCYYHNGSDECTPAHYEYANPICPSGYHVQNSGNWNQRCHRNNNSIHPEHMAPTGCPSGFSQVGNICRKTIGGDTDTRTVSCNNAPLTPCEGTPPAPVDVCPFMDGVADPNIQTVTPDGYTNDDGHCTKNEGEVSGCIDPKATNYNQSATKDDGSCQYTPEPTATPLSCSGDQHPDAAGTNCVSFTPAGPPENGGSSTSSTQGQVLGASTMAGTGSFAEDAYLAIMGVGGIITALGFKNVKKAFKVAR